MRKWIVLLMLFLCTGCSALPAEERSFVVAMGLQRSGQMWEISARMPTYQSGGGYMTLTVQASSLEEALALLDASAPMRLHLGQMRLLVCHEGLAKSADFSQTLDFLARRQDFRLHTVVCVTRNKASELIDHLDPATGSRLSKSLDVLLESRREQGVISAVTLSEILRMGERQCPVLTGATLENDTGTTRPGMDASAGNQAAQGGSKVRLSGGWMVDFSGSVKGELTAHEMQLLSLMSGRVKKGIIVLDEGAVTMLDAGCKIRQDGLYAVCRLKLRYMDAAMTQEVVESAMQNACKAVLARLAAAGCDALGIGRRVMRHAANMAQWRSLDWPGLYDQLEWQMKVAAVPAA